MMNIFIDTSFLLAKYLRKDQFHERVCDINQRLESYQSIFTSNFVIDEFLTLLGRWVGYDFAVERAKSLYSSESLIILRPELEHEKEALVYFEKFKDQKVSFTDCISMSLMKDMKISKVLSFDKHFSYAGFELVA